MGDIELKEKIRAALNETDINEYLVVFVMSRIRKLLELENIKNSYKLVNIYCNWSLHTKIDRTDDIKDILEEFVNKAETRHNLLMLNEFKSHFKKFVSEVLNINLTEDYINKFSLILLNIISDTPISFTKSRFMTITINPADLPRNEKQITYKITTIEK
ncbi:MAG: hypothetical protein Q7T59_00855 [Candidatus Woesebacteria bacterium]|nr:hypothetical protein [Candidatus Woesebacteria bacterium]